MKFSKEIVKTLCKHLIQGSSIKSACDAIGISKQTYYDWKKDKVDFVDSISKAMAIPDKKVENALYKSARGFYYNETEYKTIAGKDGITLIEIPVKKVKRMTQPNVAAQKFILVNRNPEEWKDKTEHEFSGGVALTVSDKFLPDMKNGKRKPE